MDEAQQNIELNKLSSRVSGLEADFKNMNHTMGRMADAIETLSDKVSHSNRTPWATLGVWASVVISLMGVLGYMTIQPMTENLKLLNERFYNHERSPGHQAALEISAALRQDYNENKERLIQQDEYLQREMRDLNAGMKGELDARIDGLDKRLQLEMRLLMEAAKKSSQGLNDVQQAQIESLQRQIDQLKNKKLRQ